MSLSKYTPFWNHSHRGGKGVANIMWVPGLVLGGCLEEADRCREGRGHDTVREEGTPKFWPLAQLPPRDWGGTQDRLPSAIPS